MKRKGSTSQLEPASDWVTPALTRIGTFVRMAKELNAAFEAMPRLQLRDPVVFRCLLQIHGPTLSVLGASVVFISVQSRGL